ncbi:MAG: NADH:ubiquinone reductase (Na(+)-transporting) subunit C [Schleiferiaceae bacterium]|jgi:Na+-transporting NADH:ubiquinone oxidoreductase subunit C|nr:MAG: NADH:ubiquinone reductase (Na(+)-transporting) subunit C [Bacteroidota bacterium]
MNVNSNAYTYTFATVMVVLVAVLLSGASLGLKSKQASNISQEKKQSILASIGIEVDRSESDAAFGEYIKQSLTLQGGTVVSEDASAAFDIDMAAAIKAGNMDRSVPLYVAEKEGDTYYIIPMRGKGLWGPVWGYLALESDGNTVVGATFDHKSETPGLGAEITTPMFTDQFPGKKISEAGMFKSISVVKAGTSAGDYAVDGISGGTITSNGVNDMLTDCLAPYAEYFKNI